MDKRFERSTISIKANPQPTRIDWCFSEQVKTNKTAHIAGLELLIERMFCELLPTYTLMEIKTLWFLNSRPLWTIYELSEFPNGMGKLLTDKFRFRAESDKLIEVHKNNGNGKCKLYKTTASFKRLMTKYFNYWLLVNPIPINRQVLGSLIDNPQMVELCLRQHEAIATKDKDAVYNAVKY